MPLERRPNVNPRHPQRSRRTRFFEVTEPGDKTMDIIPKFLSIGIYVTQYGVDAFDRLLIHPPTPPHTWNVIVPFPQLCTYIEYSPAKTPI